MDSLEDRGTEFIREPILINLNDIPEKYRREIKYYQKLGMSNKEILDAYNLSREIDFENGNWSRSQEQQDNYNERYNKDDIESLLQTDQPIGLMEVRPRSAAPSYTRIPDNDDFGIGAGTITRPASETKEERKERENLHEREIRIPNYIKTHRDPNAPNIDAADKKTQTQIDTLYKRVNYRINQILGSEASLDPNIKTAQFDPEELRQLREARDKGDIPTMIRLVGHDNYNQNPQEQKRALTEQYTKDVNNEQNRYNRGEINASQLAEMKANLTAQYRAATNKVDNSPISRAVYTPEQPPIDPFASTLLPNIYRRYGIPEENAAETGLAPTATQAPEDFFSTLKANQAALNNYANDIGSTLTSDKGKALYEAMARQDPNNLPFSEEVLDENRVDPVVDQDSSTSNTQTTSPSTNSNTSTVNTPLTMPTVRSLASPQYDSDTPLTKEESASLPDNFKRRGYELMNKFNDIMNIRYVKKLGNAYQRDNAITSMIANLVKHPQDVQALAFALKDIKAKNGFSSHENHGKIAEAVDTFIREYNSYINKRSQINAMGLDSTAQNLMRNNMLATLTGKQSYYNKANSLNNTINSTKAKFKEKSDKAEASGMKEVAKNTKEQQAAKKTCETLVTKLPGHGEKSWINMGDEQSRFAEICRKEFNNDWVAMSGMLNSFVSRQTSSWIPLKDKLSTYSDDFLDFVQRQKALAQISSGK